MGRSNPEFLPCYVVELALFSRLTLHVATHRNTNPYLQLVLSSFMIAITLDTASKIIHCFEIKKKRE